jgi:hypothetical protein
MCGFSPRHEQISNAQERASYLPLRVFTDSEIQKRSAIKLYKIIVKQHITYDGIIM